MATIDQLLNDIDEFEDWPFDEDESAASLTGDAEPDSNSGADLVETVLRGYSQHQVIQ